MPDGDDRWEGIKGERGGYTDFAPDICITQ